MQRCLNFTLPAFCLLLVFQHTFNSYGQSFVDSLKKELSAHPNEDTLKVIFLNELSREHVYIITDSSVHFANRALQLSIKLGYLRGQAYAYRNLGSTSSFLEDFFVTYQMLEKAQQIFSSLRDSVGLANCYISLAHSYRRQRNFSKAFEFQNNALRIFGRMNKPERIAVCLNNLGDIEFHLGNYDNAIKHLNESIVLNIRTRHYSVLMDNYANLAEVLLARNNVEQAQALVNKVFLLKDEIGSLFNTRAYTKALILMAQICKIRKQENEELTYWSEAVRFGRNYRDRQIVNGAFVGIIDFYARRKDAGRMGETISEYLHVTSQLDSIRTTNQARMMEELFGMLELKNNYQLQQEVISRQKLQLLFIIITVVLLGVFAVILLRSNLKRKSLNKQLVVKQSEILKKTADLEKLNLTKNKFFSIVAHDLKTPLNTLLSFSSLLSQHPEALSPEETKQLGKQLKDSVSTTIRMTENLMTWALSQMELNGINPQRLDLNETVKLTGKIFADAAFQKNIDLQLTVTSEIFVRADRDQIEFVVRNLLNNAIKFTGENGKVTVTTRLQDGFAEVSVHDTGVGVEPERLNSLFEIGTKSSTPGTAGEKGTGLGLVLCKEFIEQNGGTIRVASAPGTGSTFSITLPLAI